MILADTSVWVDHLRQGDNDLMRALQASEVLIHPFVIGEIALGHLRDRATVLKLLAGLPMTDVVDDPVLWKFIEDFGMPGRGIGYVDAHLLASVRATSGARLWTRDRRLAALAAELGLSI